MNKIKIAVCIRDSEYKKRFVNCLMNHYRNQLELHLFSGENELAMSGGDGFCALLLSEEITPGEEFEGIPRFYLVEGAAVSDDKQQEGCWYLDKYQPVSRIVEEIFSHIGGSTCELQENGVLAQGCRLTGIYSLSESELQLPYALTYGSIVSERESVLLLDLQENSGLSGFREGENGMGLEDLLIMAENGRYSATKLVSCIGHLGHMDFVYPAVNSECLCEANSGTYSRLIRILTRELDYREIVINFGSRFSGFFELMEQCGQIWLLQKQGGGCTWRENEFMQELQRKEASQLTEHIRRTELPFQNAAGASFERLVEQWKWSEFGDRIRNGMTGVMYGG